LPTSPRPPTRPTPRHDTRWVGLAPDERRAARRALLIDVAFELLGTDGSDATTVRALCQRARLNPRYFYESFEDLDSLLVAVYDHVVEQLAAEVIGAQREAPPDPRSQLRAAIERSVAFVDDDPRRGRILYVEALGNEALNKRRKDAGRALVGLVEQAAAEAHGAMPSARVARIGAAILVGGMSELLVEWIEGRIHVSRERLVDTTTDLFLALGEAAAAQA
jgi:AcrR family transcriptional regulator